MIVVLDTNALHGDVHAQGGWLETLFAAAEDREDLEVWTPRTVVEELVRQFPERLREVRKAVKQHGHDLAALGLSRPEVPADVEAEARAYRPRLEARLQGDGRQIGEQPSSAGKALTWAAQRRKPVKPDGTGVSDAAIWLTVVEAARLDDVVFVTNNHLDFAEEDDKARPHPVLRADLDEEGIPDRVALIPRVLDFNEGYIAASREATREGEELLADPSIKALLEQEIYDAVGWFPLDLDTGELLLDADVDAANLAAFDIEKLRLVRVDKGPTGLFLTLVVSGSGLFDVYLWKAEAFILPDESPIRVHDYDWNESMAAAQVELPSELLVEARYREGEWAVSIDEVDLQPD